jgi:hypothetical protein
MSNENMGELIVLFKSYDELRRDECEVYREHYDAWHAAYRRWDLVKAALADDDTELAKLAGSDRELGLAKSEAARLKKQHGDLAGFFANVELAARLRALVEKRNASLYGVSALAKRSLRFAMASERRYYGPAATVTTIGAKQ